MKCERENRRLVVSDLPPTVEGLTIPRRVTIDVRYTDDPEEGYPLDKALALDRVILPAIAATLNRCRLDARDYYPEAEVVECAYCSAWAADRDPREFNETEWAREARFHAPRCEWVETRAHTREVEA